MDIYVLDLGLGNPLPVARMIERAGGHPRLTSSAMDINANSSVVIPGVGAFDAGMHALRDRGFDSAIAEIADRGTGRILGLCLGMQLLFDESEEGSTPGLGLVRGIVRRIPTGLGVRVPHMGWNPVHVKRDSRLLRFLPPEPRFYFAHSYFAQPVDADLSSLSVHHGLDFCAALEKGNVVGAQFHPEKSHRFGLEFMRGFVRA